MGMRRAMAGLLVVASVSHGAIAAAEGTQRGADDGLSGLQAELGIGVALPAGDVGDNWGKLSDATVFAVPMDINLGYRLSERLGIGAYFLLAPAFPGQDLALCDGADHCRAIMVRLGVHAQYHFAPRAGIDPWLGLGAGSHLGFRGGWCGPTEARKTHAVEPAMRPGRVAAVACLRRVRSTAIERSGRRPTRVGILRSSRAARSLLRNWPG